MRGGGLSAFQRFLFIPKVKPYTQSSVTHVRLKLKGRNGVTVFPLLYFFILLNSNVRLLNFNNDMVAMKRQRGEIFIIGVKKDFNWSQV